ncbi:MAG: hypothetical protein IJ836_08600 [Spirochaetales bacterium]|nr:hypothetical protein [Spirochaetales bacterium]
MKTDYVMIDNAIYRHFHGDSDDTWSLERLSLDDGKLVGRKPTQSESKKALLALMSDSFKIISISQAVKHLEENE